MIAALLLSLLVALPSAATPASIATGQAEYRLSWNGIPAGAATIIVRRDQEGGEPVYRVEALARTSWLVDLLWRFRGRAASSFTSADLFPLGFRYDRDENSKHIVTDVRFDRTHEAATGTKQRGGSTEVIQLQEPGVIDPITAIFRALARPVHVGDVFHYDVFTGEARYRVELAVESEDTVRVAGGAYRAWRIEPQVWKVGTGVDTRLRHATLWVSEDPAHVLLRIRSEVFIGSVTCDLLRLQMSGSEAS